MTTPGVYRSDVDGHLFVLNLEPFSISCVVCMTTCSRLDKTYYEFQKAATEFTNEHGYLDERIADNIVQMIPPRSTK